MSCVHAVRCPVDGAPSTMRRETVRRETRRQETVRQETMRQAQRRPVVGRLQMQVHCISYEGACSIG